MKTVDIFITKNSFKMNERLIGLEKFTLFTNKICKYFVLKY